jgi:putative membrane-bound dehydrogenase-like protein
MRARIPLSNTKPATIARFLAIFPLRISFPSQLIDFTLFHLSTLRNPLISLFFTFKFQNLQTTCSANFTQCVQEVFKKHTRRLSSAPPSHQVDPRFESHQRQDTAFSFRAAEGIIPARMDCRAQSHLSWPMSVLLGFVICLLGEAVLHAAEFRVPQGFTIESATDQARVRFPMFAALDDEGRLFVAESSGLDLYEELQKLTRRCRVSRLEDTNRDGVFDQSQLFADQLVFPMGLVWRDGKLYVADPPDLITLEDTNGDGRADKRTVLLTGFGHTDNGSLHGLTFGPDGWLYLTMGQPDGFHIKRRDGKIVEGKSGALLRCKPDGSELEVVCRGFENLVEVVFMPTGEIIGTDNWFFLPQDGVRDALVHLVPGGVYPLNAHAQTETSHFFTGELLPALQVYPAVALSGLMRYNGHALPAPMQGSLFSAQFNARKIVRHELRRHGSTFQSTDEDFVTTDNPDFHPSDVLEDRDGSILVVDTGSWYVHHCPTGRIRKTPAEGGLYRVRYTSAPALTRSETNDWTADIWRSAMIRIRSGLNDGSYHWTEFRRSELHPDLNWPADRLALWLRALSRGINTSPSITNLLLHPAAHVRLAAAEAAVATRAYDARPAIVTALENETDPFIVHALIRALAEIADPQALKSLLNDPRPSVRRGAFLALNQPRYKLTVDEALRALSDPPLRRSALRLFQQNPAWSGEALSFLQRRLSAEDTPENRLALRDLLPAFIKRREIIDLVHAIISDETKAPALRLLMLEILSQTGAASGVTGASSTPALRAALTASDPALTSAAIGAIQGAHADALAHDLARVARAPERPLSLRLDALRALVRRRPALEAESFDLVMGALSATHSPALRLAAAELLASAELTSAQLQSFVLVARDDRVISPSLVISAAQRAKSPGAEPLVAYLLDSINSGWQIPDAALAWLERTFRADAKLDQLRAAALRSVEERVAKLTALEPLLQGGDPNAGHQLFLGRLACATCHRVGKTGGVVGPDLTRIGAIRSGRDLIESLVLPSATMAQGYDTYQVTLDDGETLTGIRVRQPDDAFVLRDSSGAEMRLQPSQIQKAERLQTSLMPEGLVSSLQQQEIRDLLAYLQSLK